VYKFQTRFLCFASGGVVRKRFAVGMLLSFFVVLCAGGILAFAAGGNRFISRYQAFSDPDGGFANLNLG